MEDIVNKLTAEFLKSLAHPARVNILKQLAPGERCVCELIQELELEQSNLSQHLSILKKQGVIESRKEGTKVFYKIMYPGVLQIVNLVEEILGEQVSKSHSLLRHLK